MAYWLLKSDPESYSFADLARDKQTVWDGIRNHQARNYLARMKVGDGCLVYHSGEERAIVGTARIARAAYGDPGAEDPRWLNVDLRVGKRLARPLCLADIKAHRILARMAILKQSRLSVCPVTEEEWRVVGELTGSPDL